MKALITGGTGFIGYYLTKMLLDEGHEVTATHYDSGSLLETERVEGADYRKLDISSQPEVKKIVDELQPDEVYHLAGQAYPVPSWKDPARTFEVNVLGSIHLFEAVRNTGKQTKIINACSGAEYGDRVKSPIIEESVLRPLSPYGVSKAAQDMLVSQYFQSYAMPIYSLRLFGTTGPGKSGDAINDFASQIAAAEITGQEIKVGRLDVIRDVSDVRDVVKAFILVMDKGAPGEAYNVGSGQHFTVADLLSMLLSLAKAKIGYGVEQARIRPSDEKEIFPDTSKIRGIGYSPKYDIKQTMTDILDFWRGQLAKEAQKSKAQ